MYCNHCGQDNAVENVYCCSCGILSLKKTASIRLAFEERSFCGACGFQLEWGSNYCPGCGGELSKFKLLTSQA
ncbi:zinc ribbon domain-containing protein [Candidatus Contubernalis alkaliaceticus]|uniref:zinc ribbon domain-containing protein n=1 Tax=Candidatus Contubernalis alkaliaceticus TaxID=338645 RepID=UPI001F4C1EDB|nr:zinc ribbon domain-containing protein [Candidatus Contubernalis alkalaceticus]UNC91138.1 zinc ribbon domain-containing protein [Candidatus Contubernalis alkalaceticus]